VVARVSDTKYSVNINQDNNRKRSRNHWFSGFNLASSIKGILRKYMLWNIASSELYILDMDVLLECCHI
jgi:hypothetical protein